MLNLYCFDRIAKRQMEAASIGKRNDLTYHRVHLKLYGIECKCKKLSTTFTK